MIPRTNLPPQPAQQVPIPPFDLRVLELEAQVLDLQLELQTMREEMASLAKIAGMANDEAQRTALRVDVLDHAWMEWTDGQPPGSLGPHQPEPEGGNQPSSTALQQPLLVPLTGTAPTPNSMTPRNREAVVQQPDLLQLEDDPLHAWYEGSGTPGLGTQLLPHASEPPRTLTPLSGGTQLTAVGEAMASAPPGTGLVTALTAAVNPAGGWT